MKSSGVCTKCACRKLYVVKQVTQPEHDSKSATIPLWLMTAMISQDGTSYRSHACMLEAWVCSACSFTELYGKDVSELEVLARHPGGGVRVHQSSDKPPYR